jgi:RNA polymerase sigma-70 factor (ECF subfamily)
MSIERAKAGDERAFASLVEPHRRELQLHCYRMLGSMQDAEDLVQETLLAAWRGLGGFQERASLRAWLYRIATNRSLNALRRRGRRPPVQEPLAAPPPTRYIEPSWLEPYPDSALPDRAPGPEARYEQRETIGLAFIAGLQRLPERERAPVPDSPAERELVARFGDAIEAGDTIRLIALLTDDARMTMPPLPLEYTGRAAIAAFLDYRDQIRGAPLAVRATRANGAPAFGCSLHSRPRGLLALTLSGGQVAEMTFFSEPSLLARFDLWREV